MLPLKKRANPPAAAPKPKDCDIRNAIPNSRTMSAYHYRPLTCADLPMVARWLETPEVMRWGGDPKEQIDLITEDLDESLMRQWIVEHQSRAFAYLQTYPANAWPQRHLTHLPNGAVVIDETVDVWCRWIAKVVRQAQAGCTRSLIRLNNRNGLYVFAVPFGGCPP
jgi:hypothetical protein